MKKCCKLLVLLVLVTKSFYTLQAQERILSKSEFHETERSAFEKLKNKSYRTNGFSESYQSPDAPPVRITNTITEFVPPNRTRIVSKVKKNNENFSYESVMINQKRYEKINNEDWKESESEKITNDLAISSDKGEIYKYKGKEFVDSEESDLYEYTRIIDIGNKETAETLTVRKTFWLNKNGLFVKIESETLYDKKKRVSYSLTEYTYDTNIKIEAPIK